MKSLLFVDDEPRVLQGLQRQLRVMRNEWQMNFVDSGAKALEFLAANPVDVIVTDMMMPGMDGAALLCEVLKRHPDTVRLVLSGHSDREAVLRLVGPAHQYLSKPCSADDLRIAIDRALGMRSLLTNPRLKQLVSRLPSLPSLPALHAQLTEELQKEEPSVTRVAAIVSHDPAMAAKILQLVNSAFFGLPQQATNVADAVAYLGLATLRALVLSLQVFSQFAGQKPLGFSIDELADHCWTTGVYARRIAALEKADARVEDQCFLSGLLHDVGHLILATGLPEVYAQAHEESRQHSRSLWEVELSEMGASHAEVGAYLLGLWGLPNPVVEAVALHHRPADGPVKGFSAVVAVHVADWCAHHRSPQPPESSFITPDLQCLKAFGLDQRLPVWQEECQQKS
jgi:HD-like signal output (HDOD) protein